MTTRTGFSLIEVLVAVAMFGVGLSALFQSFSTAGRLAQHERHMTHALHSAERVFEDLLAQPVTPHGTSQCFDRAGNSIDAFGCDLNTSYRVDVMVNQHDTVPGVVRLVAIAEWRESNDDRTHSLRFETWRY